MDSNPKSNGRAAGLDPVVDALLEINRKLLGIIEEKDAQIRMVLDSKFYRPEIDSGDRPAQRPIVEHPEYLADVQSFPIEDDNEQVRADQDRADHAEDEFGKLFAEEVGAIAAEQDGAPREPDEIVAARTERLRAVAAQLARPSET